MRFYNNVACATSKASDAKPARILLEFSMSVKLLTERLYGLSKFKRRLYMLV